MVGLHHGEQLGELTCLHQFDNSLAHGLYLIHVHGAETQESAYIHLLHLIALVQISVHLVQALIDCIELLIGSIELLHSPLQSLVGILEFSVGKFLLVEGSGYALALLVHIEEQAQYQEHQQDDPTDGYLQIAIGGGKLLLKILLYGGEHRHNLTAADRCTKDGGRLPGKLDVVVRASQLLLISLSSHTQQIG